MAPPGRRDARESTIARRLIIKLKRDGVKGAPDMLQCLEAEVRNQVMKRRRINNQLTAELRDAARTRREQVTAERDVRRLQRTFVGTRSDAPPHRDQETAMRRTLRQTEDMQTRIMECDHMIRRLAGETATVRAINAENEALRRELSRRTAEVSRQRRECLAQSAKEREHQEVLHGRIAKELEAWAAELDELRVLDAQERSVTAYLYAIATRGDAESEAASLGEGPPIDDVTGTSAPAEEAAENAAADARSGRPRRSEIADAMAFAVDGGDEDLQEACEREALLLRAFGRIGLSVDAVLRDASSAGERVRQLMAAKQRAEDDLEAAFRRQKAEEEENLRRRRAAGSAMLEGNGSASRPSDNSDGLEDPAELQERLDEQRRRGQEVQRLLKDRVRSLRREHRELRNLVDGLANAVEATLGAHTGATVRDAFKVEMRQASGSSTGGRRGSMIGHPAAHLRRSSSGSSGSDKGAKGTRWQLRSAVDEACQMLEARKQQISELQPSAGAAAAAAPSADGSSTATASRGSRAGMPVNAIVTPRDANNVRVESRSQRRRQEQRGPGEEDDGGDADESVGETRVDGVAFEADAMAAQAADATPLSPVATRAAGSGFAAARTVSASGASRAPASRAPATEAEDSQEVPGRNEIKAIARIMARQQIASAALQRPATGRSASMTERELTTLATLS